MFFWENILSFGKYPPPPPPGSSALNQRKMLTFFVLNFSKLLFDCSTTNFGPLSRGQPHSPKGSFLTRLGPQAQPSSCWDLNRETSDSNCNNLSHYATLPTRPLSLVPWVRFFSKTLTHKIDQLKNDPNTLSNLK